MIFHAAYWAPAVAREIGVTLDWALGKREAHNVVAHAIPALSPSLERDAITRARLISWELAKLF